MVNPSDHIIEPKRRERVHGPASLGLEPEDVGAGRVYLNQVPLIWRRRRDDTGGVGAEEGGA